MFLTHILAAFLQGDPESLLAAGLGAMLQGAKKALDGVINDHNPVNEVENTLKDWAKNLYEDVMPDPEDLNEVVDRVKEVYESVKSEGETVFQDIANDVNSALGTGQIPDEGDAGLGQTHDNFTPGGDQFSVGQTPGIDIGGVGQNRTGDGGGGGTGDVGYGGGSGSSGSSPTPLGVSGSGAGTSSGERSSSSGGSSSSTGVTPPTASDLGIDANSGAYIEYQPSEGQVQITYPDGTTETRPWPPQ